MKQLLITCVIFLGSVTAGLANLPTISVSSHTTGCNVYIDVTYSGNSTPIQLWVAPYTNTSLTTWGPVVWVEYCNSPSTRSIQITLSGTKTYRIWGHCIAHGWETYAINRTVTAPCKKPPVGPPVVIVRDPPSPYRVISVGPEDPNEDPGEVGEVKWAIEELNPLTSEVLYRIDDPSCWSSSNAAGASNNFTAFDNIDNAYSGIVTQLDCNEAEGLFAEDGVYRFIRSVRSTPDDEWVESFAYYGYPDICDGCLGKTTLQSGVRDQTVAQIDCPVFPNPSKGSFMIMLPGTVTNAEIELYNLLGERVDVITMKENVLNYSNSQLSAGIYLLRISNNGLQLTKRIVIE